MRNLGFLVIAFCALAATVGVSEVSPQSAGNGGGPALRGSHLGGGAFGPCEDDVKRLCPDVKPGQGRVARCLQKYEAELTSECREHQRRKRAEFREARSACTEDVKRFCQGVKLGQGRMAACLKRHEAELSPACRQELPRQ